MPKPYWLDDDLIDEEGGKPSQAVKELAEALSEEYQNYRIWGMIQAWHKAQIGE